MFRKSVPGRFQGRFQRGSGALFPEQGLGKVLRQVPGRVPRRFWGKFRSGMFRGKFRAGFQGSSGSGSDRC